MKKKNVKKPVESIETLSEMREEFEGIVRRKFKKWKKDNGIINVRSSTIKDPNTLMMIAMSTDEDDA